MTEDEISELEDRLTEYTIQENGTTSKQTWTDGLEVVGQKPKG